MTDFLPIVEDLENSQTHLERAQWLLACPLDILRGHAPSIRIVLQRAGFLAGVVYVEAERTALSATRLPNGNHKPGVELMLRAAREELALAASIILEDE